MQKTAKFLLTGATDPWLLENVEYDYDTDQGLIYSTTATNADPATVILPFMINAHTHLELSFLHNRLPRGLDFVPWLGKCIDIGMNTPFARKKAAFTRALASLWQTGTGVVVDINNDTSIYSNIDYPDQRFHIVRQNEILGFDPREASTLYAAAAAARGNMDYAITGHSAYAASGTLLQTIRQAEDGMLSIHCMEHNAEMDLFRTRSGPMVDYLRQRGYDLDGWQPGTRNIIQYLQDNAAIRSGDLLVHLVHAGNAEFTEIKDNHYIPVICPRSNTFLNNGLPDLPGMLNAGLAPLLGTDSLASNDSLDILDELIFALQQWPDVPGDAIFRMVTHNGQKVFSKKTTQLFFPLQTAMKMPFQVLTFRKPVVDIWQSLRHDQIVKREIYA
jgi:cytosine/adenosine deaminase-related metal-dependent hydrolase